MMLDREASQIILWDDNLTNLKSFKKELKFEKDGIFIKGSRFMQISSICNKRIAKKLISHAYDIQFRDKYSINIIALGDSKNDIDMLNSCKYSCLIKNSNGTDLARRGLRDRPKHHGLRRLEAGHVALAVGDDLGLGRLRAVFQLEEGARHLAPFRIGLCDHGREQHGYFLSFL